MGPWRGEKLADGHNKALASPKRQPRSTHLHSYCTAFFATTHLSKTFTTKYRQTV